MLAQCSQPASNFEAKGFVQTRLCRNETRDQHSKVRAGSKAASERVQYLCLDNDIVKDSCLADAFALARVVWPGCCGGTLRQFSFRQCKPRVPGTAPWYSCCEHRSLRPEGSKLPRGKEEQLEITRGKHRLSLPRAQLACCAPL